MQHPCQSEHRVDGKSASTSEQDRRQNDDQLRFWRAKGITDQLGPAAGLLRLDTRPRIQPVRAGHDDQQAQRGEMRQASGQQAQPAGQLATINNRVVLTVEGVREKLRVLLVSGEPHAGERTWRNMLKSDASVDLVHFTILRPPEKQDGTPINQLSLIAFPTRELFQQKISEFQLIIFDRYARQGVLPMIYFDNIARYVRDGGAVLIAAGPDYASPSSIWRTPLDAILPAEPSGSVTEKPFEPELTELGKRHPVTRGLEGSQYKDRKSTRLNSSHQKISY